MNPIVAYKTEMTRREGMDAMEPECISPMVMASHVTVQFNALVCTGCQKCLEACPNDVLGPNPEPQKPPVVLHPDECWLCGCCLMECPVSEKGAIEFKWPLKFTIRWKRKKTGEHYRVGMPNPPQANPTPPVGGWNIKNDG